MIRRIAFVLPLLFAITAGHAAPIDNKDGFWSEWNDASSPRPRARRNS